MVTEAGPEDALSQLESLVPGYRQFFEPAAVRLPQLAWMMDGGADGQSTAPVADGANAGASLDARRCRVSCLPPPRAVPRYASDHRRTESVHGGGSRHRAGGSALRLLLPFSVSGSGSDVLQVVRSRYPGLDRHRFGLAGELMDQRTPTPVTAGLHHHGDDPDRAGYTLAEVLHLTRSAHAPQAAVSLRMLAGIVGRVRRFEYPTKVATVLQAALSEVGGALPPPLGGRGGGAER